METRQVDIVSDVVCPWSIIGFKKLQKALENKIQVKEQTSP